MPDIDGELEHGEAIALQILSKLSCGLPFFLCVGWQIKEYENPHYTILTKSRIII